jgi:hypothetical protein
MPKLIFAFLLAVNLLLTPAVERGSFEVVANSSRATAVKVFFSQPFKIMEKNACTATFTKSGIQREHGGGEVQDYSLAWVQIIAEVGEKVDWVCKGER